MNTEILESLLCQSMCANVTVRERTDGQWQILTPFIFPDGDFYSFYINELSTGGLRISDMGSTMMHLSYENDTKKFRDGMRGKLLTSIIAEMDLQEDQGEFFIETIPQNLGKDIVHFGQGLTRVHDLTFLNRFRVEGTFYEDLREKLESYTDSENIHEDYIVDIIPNANIYPIDYYISGGRLPLYLFGVPNKDKAKLATIVLQHLNAAGIDFDSMIVFQNMADIPRQDLSRLTNAANDMVASVDDNTDFERKFRKKISLA